MPHDRLQIRRAFFAALSSLMLFAAANARADEAPRLLWQRTLEEREAGTIQRLQSLLDGGVFITTVDSSETMTMVVHDPDGTPRVRQNFPPGSRELFLRGHIALHRDGGITIAGVQLLPEQKSIGWIERLEGKNRTGWKRTLQTPETDPNTLVTAQNSDVIAGGAFVTEVGSYKGVWLARLRSSGEILWERTVTDLPDITLTGLVELRDGTILVAGGSATSAYLARTDPEGARIWEWSSSDPQTKSRVPAALLALSDGDAMVFGHGEWSNGSRFGWIAALDPEGRLRWEKKYPRLGFSSAAQLPNGQIVAGGTVDPDDDKNRRAAVFAIAPSGERSWTFPLEANAVVLQLAARNDGSFVALATAQVRDKRSKAFLAAIAPPSEAAPPAIAKPAIQNSSPAIQAPVNPNAVAVVIGNRRYGKDVPTVEFAHNDAQAMRDYAVERLGVDSANLIDLRDATQGTMYRVFGNERSHEGELWRRVRPGRSDVIVYYSGHGMPGLKDGRSYLLPVDGDPNAAEVSGVALETLYSNLAKLGARSVTIFLDACFSGESANGTLLRSASGITVVAKPARQEAAVTVIAAAQPTQIASWDTATKQGLFTRYLLEALRGAADRAPTGNADGAVSVGEVKAYLDGEMTFAARRLFGRHQQASVQGPLERLIVDPRR